jgi:hypothetical protein
MRSATIVIVLLGVLGTPATGERAGKAATSKGPPTPKPSSGWEALLVPPKSTANLVPGHWKVVKEPRNLLPVGYEGGGKIAGSSRALDRLTEGSVIIVAGIGAGNDGGFYPLGKPRTPRMRQFTTYYLKVFGYLKDQTGRRARFLKILAPGGFLDGGQQGGESVPLPYLETGRRYLLYLTPNYGIPWGSRGPTGIPLGTADAYWASDYGLGYWYENDQGNLASPLFSTAQWPDSIIGLPFAQAVKREVVAVKRREKRELLPGSVRSESKGVSPGRNR